MLITQRQAERKQKLRNRNEKENNCMDTSSDKQAKSYTRITERGYEREI